MEKDNEVVVTGDDNRSKNWENFALFATVAGFYWYALVLGACAQANGLPVPDFIPMTPGWPATEEDFKPVIEDSFHFFYLSELLHNEQAPYVIPPRLVIFNFVEAWIFALLPALWKDSKRLPRPVLLGSWLLLGINLTNAFLAPYLALTEIREPAVVNGKNMPKNQIFSRTFGIIASLVVSFAFFQMAVVATGSDWQEFFELARTDRTYLAFCIDPLVLTVFQPFILARARNDSSQPLDFVPFVGLAAWLFQDESD